MERKNRNEKEQVDVVSHIDFVCQVKKEIILIHFIFVK